MQNELYMAKPCESCEGPMTEQRSVLPGGPLKKYCSARCRQRAFKQRQRERPRVTKVGPPEHDISEEEIEARFQAARRLQRRAA